MPSSLVGNRITLADPSFQWSDLSRFSIALLGVDSGNDTEVLRSVRNAFYKLHLHTDRLNIIDLGDISSESGELESVLQRISEANALLLLLDPSSHTQEAVFRHALTAGNYSSITSLSASVSAKELALYGKHSKSSLTRYSAVGYQSYLTNPSDLRLLAKHCCEGIRLGELRATIATCEPIFRDTHLLLADMNAVRSGDGGTMSEKTPNGLYAEELCQLAWYAGVSDHLSYSLIHGFGSKQEPTLSTYQLVAETLWHMAEGYASRKRELPTEKHVKRFFVDKGEAGEELHFYQSALTNRWWMGIPLLENEGTEVVIACTHGDYMKACAQEIPDRWLFFYQKLNAV